MFVLIVSTMHSFIRVKPNFIVVMEYYARVLIVILCLLGISIAAAYNPGIQSQNLLMMVSVCSIWVITEIILDVVKFMFRIASDR